MSQRRDVVYFNLAGNSICRPTNRDEHIMYDFMDFAEIEDWDAGVDPCLPKTYRVDDRKVLLKPQYDAEYAKEKRKAGEYDAELGFVTPRDVPREYFRGLMINSSARPHQSWNLRRELEALANSESLSPSPFTLDYFNAPSASSQIERAATVDLVVKLTSKIFADDPAQMLPIYDWGGSLLWPCSMSRGQVKQYVAARSTT